MLVDDGLASGYTMKAAIEVIRRKNPLKIIVAVPTAPASTVDAMKEIADIVICPNIREGFSFAVASAYREWYDLNKEEVLELLQDAPWVRD
jgi:predicted phosphoribosyltransferase